MCKQLIKYFLLFVFSLSLTACNGFFEKDNTRPPTPLKPIKSEVKPRLAWSTKTGSGTEGEYLKMHPALSESAIFTASLNGKVTSVNQINGHINWQTATKLPLVAGPGVGNGIVVVGSQQGEVLALQQVDGKTLWRTSIPGEILASPVIANDIVVIKAVDGYVRGLSVQNGEERWSYQQTEPTMILRGSSKPLIQNGKVLVGFANGNLAQLSLADGQLFWQQPVAVAEGSFPIERMIDIDANPIIFEHRIYAATYQGSLAALDWGSGKVLWTHDISTFTGMTADDNAVYISDAKGDVFAFNADNGFANWRQTQLEARIVSGPAHMGNYIVVGDAEGYLHWLSKADGHLAGRASAGKGIYAAPIVNNHILYVLTSNGTLLAYTMA